MSDEQFMGVDVDELAALAAGDPAALRQLILELQTENDALRGDVVRLSGVARAWRDATRHHDEAHGGRFGQCPHHVCEGARRISSQVLNEVALRLSS